ncbi:MAPEG family protein [Erythrobacter sp. THAF29]|uniref:MAPEG family protein n=1 Tax=Erythrobacter sp. THAF29 TaxID=2587851 RepID=UPI0012681E6D|nr:MAPEG family protein [Erythrobacter sp. THAF29]QFT76660.1 MAPEG family protein [Erythrobacter sp. THAF29]
MNLPLYTAALGAFIIVLQVVLMVGVGSRRLKGPVIGTGDDKDMERRMRRHGNLAENAGLFVAVLAIYELLVGQTAYLAALCILFAVARLSHAAAFSSLAGSHGEGLTGGRKIFSLFRIVGAFGTLLTALGVAGGIVAELL